MVYVICYRAVNQMAVEEEYISGLVRCLKVKCSGSCVTIIIGDGNGDEEAVSMEDGPATWLTM